MATDDREETVFSPERHGGGRRVPLERPAVAPKPDHTGRSADGPQTAKFDPDDIPDEDVAAGVAQVTGGPPDRRPAGRTGKKDPTLQRFLDGA